MSLLDFVCASLFAACMMIALYEGLKAFNLWKP